MSTSETGKRKGRFFQAIAAPSADLKSPTVRPPTASRTAPPPGPTGEAPDVSGNPEAAANILGKMAVATDEMCGGAEQHGDDVTNLTELLFSRSLGGFLTRGGQQDDIDIIQTIFNANNVSQLDAEDTASNLAGQSVTPGTELVPSTKQPAPVYHTDQTQLSKQSLAGTGSPAHSPFSVQGEQKGDVLRLNRSSDVKGDKSETVANKVTERRDIGGRQRAADMYQMRLPKLQVQTADTKKTDDCATGTKDGGRRIDMICRGTKKRSRRRQMLKSEGPGDGSSVSYPCPCNLTVIKRRGRRTTTRTCSPMPSPRKPLPPIRRRHHSDICTVCPEVHDWKGLARNSRWYPDQKRAGRKSSCELTTDEVVDSCTHHSDTHRVEFALKHSETVDCQGTQFENREMDTVEDEEKCGTTEQDKKEGSNWFPERSIPAQMTLDQDVQEEDKIKDVTCRGASSACAAIRNAHCPWLGRGLPLSVRQSGADEDFDSNSKACTGNGDKFDATRTLMEGMDFECDNRPGCDGFEDDGVFLQAVILRNHALNHGMVADSVPLTSSTEVRGQESADSDIQPETRDVRKGVMYDRTIPFKYYTRPVQDQASCPSTEKAVKEVLQLTATRQVSHMGLIPKAEVIMTSRGQQMVVNNSSLVAVGRGQSGNDVKISAGRATRACSYTDVRRDDSSDMLLKQEMNRYLHSVRHDKATGSRHPSLSSALNIPMKVQNLTAVRPITADVSSSSVLTNQVTKAVGFIPILTREEYEGLCKKTPGPCYRFPRSPALPPIVRNPSDVLLIKEFDGEVKGRQLPRRRQRKK